jgi:hypothetical protein
MTITIEFFGLFTLHLVNGFAWLFIGILASFELYIAVGLSILHEKISNKITDVIKKRRVAK